VARRGKPCLIGLAIERRVLEWSGARRAGVIFLEMDEQIMERVVGQAMHAEVSGARQTSVLIVSLSEFYSA
jgi:hypothetical protein